MEKKKTIPIFQGDICDFPSSEELPQGVKTIELKDTFGYPFRLIPEIVYAKRSGETQKLHLLLPYDWNDSEKLFPLIVFIQGSAWHRQQVFEHMPHMVRICQQGYAVAMVEYRPSELAPFPAQIHDAKAAVRFMRMNAEKYNVDSQKIALWGDSSGGHTVVMAGITADCELDTELYKEFSCKVQCIIDWYGPTDISKMNDVLSSQNHIEPDSPEGYLIGRKNVLENLDLVAPTIPMNYLSADKEIPPIMIMHGSRDDLVNFNQSCLLYNTLKELDKEVEMYKLEGATHGAGGFNSEEAVMLVSDFLAKYLKVK